MCSIRKCCTTINDEILRAAQLIFDDNDFKDKSNRKIISSSYKFDASNYKHEKILDNQGVYIFIFKNNCTINVEDFNNCKFSSKIHSKKKTLKIEPNKVLYIGKTKSLKTRFVYHFGSRGKAPYSLHLNHKKRKSVTPFLEVRCYFLNQKLKDYYNIIARQLEKAIAEKYNKNLLIINR